jgi:hypothetical protein
MEYAILRAIHLCLHHVEDCVGVVTGKCVLDVVHDAFAAEACVALIPSEVVQLPRLGGVCGLLPLTDQLLPGALAGEDEVEGAEWILHIHDAQRLQPVVTPVLEGFKLNYEG